MSPPVNVPRDSALQTCPREERPCGQTALGTLHAHRLLEDPFSKKSSAQTCPSLKHEVCEQPMESCPLVALQAPLQPHLSARPSDKHPGGGAGRALGGTWKGDSCSCLATLLDSRLAPHPAVLITPGPFQPRLLAAAWEGDRRGEQTRAGKSLACSGLSF